MSRDGQTSLFGKRKGRECEVPGNSVERKGSLSGDVLLPTLQSVSGQIVTRVSPLFRRTSPWRPVWLNKDGSRDRTTRLYTFICVKGYTRKIGREF